jgi:hypothetical protein
MHTMEAGPLFPFINQFNPYLNSLKAVREWHRVGNFALRPARLTGFSCSCLFAQASVPIALLNGIRSHSFNMYSDLSFVIHTNIRRYIISVIDKKKGFNNRRIPELQIKWQFSRSALRNPRSLKFKLVLFWTLFEYDVTFLIGWPIWPSDKSCWLM